MNGYPTRLEELAKDTHGQPLICSGCAHSTGAEAFPGSPSGERPCCFCTRNVQLGQMLTEARASKTPHFMPDAYGKTWTAYYDNGPMKKCPMDCYISTDRLTNDVPTGSRIIT